jgi:hypothetical protein
MKLYHAALVAGASLLFYLAATVLLVDRLYRRLSRCL